MLERYRRWRQEEDRRSGEIVAMLFNINRDSEKSRGIDWTDVYQEWKEPAPEQTEEDMFNVMQQFAISTQKVGEA